MFIDWFCYPDVRYVKMKYTYHIPSLVRLLYAMFSVQGTPMFNSAQGYYRAYLKYYGVHRSQVSAAWTIAEILYKLEDKA